MTSAKASFDLVGLFDFLEDVLVWVKGLRCLGMRWLKIVAAMIRNHTPYDSALHARNQLQHGSWVLQLTQSTKVDAH